jgi:hypothetical protein
MSYWRRRVTRSVGGVAEEDYVGFDVTAGDEEFLGVGRPAEAVDLFGREMGNLAARFAVEWLQPEVLRIFLAANHVEERGNWDCRPSGDRAEDSGEERRGRWS